jgi:MoxR-like ATPase
MPASAEGIVASFAAHGYVADRALAMTVLLATRIDKPMLLEGEAGVGKTEVAKVLARALETELIRLQCYEGLDVHTALYEWNYARQMLAIRVAEAAGERREAIEQSLFAEDFLLERPLLRAIRHRGPRRAVLLIDEIDRADEEFEAFLLELLSDYQVTIPELGTITAVRSPLVVLTSNRSRELSDALKRRCLYLWIDYPSEARERDIVQTKIPAIAPSLAAAVARAMQALRSVDLLKPPGVAETLDWSRALLGLGVSTLDAGAFDDTVGCVLKCREDVERLRAIGAAALLGGTSPETATRTPDARP